MKISVVLRSSKKKVNKKKSFTRILVVSHGFVWFITLHNHHIHVFTFISLEPKRNSSTSILVFKRFYSPTLTQQPPSPPFFCALSDPIKIFPLLLRPDCSLNPRGLLLLMPPWSFHIEQGTPTTEPNITYGKLFGPRFSGWSGPRRTWLSTVAEIIFISNVLANRPTGEESFFFITALTFPLI